MKRYDFEIKCTSKTHKQWAQHLRSIAQEYDPQVSRNVLMAAMFLAGATLSAAMDYGDFWVCFGDCTSIIEKAVEGVK